MSGPRKRDRIALSLLAHARGLLALDGGDAAVSGIVGRVHGRHVVQVHGDGPPLALVEVAEALLQDAFARVDADARTADGRAHVDLMADALRDLGAVLGKTVT